MRQTQNRRERAAVLLPDTTSTDTTIMDTDRLLSLLNDPAALESLYRESPKAFRQSLNEARAKRPDDIVLRVWAARLTDGPQTELTARTLGPALGIALACGLLVRLPAIWLGAEWYYPRFAPACVLLAVALYFWRELRDRRQLVVGVILAATAGTLASTLPSDLKVSASSAMALIHLPILFWAFVGFVFTGAAWRDTEPRIRFLRFNGELLILGSLVALGGIVFSGLTMALFTLISKEAAKWYAENIGVIGAAAVPVAATYLYDVVFRRRTGIASVLARIFAPLFLVMTASYLVMALLGGQNPFVNREFLITVNGLLLVVLGMSVLSIAERGEDDVVGWVDKINLALLAVTLLIDVLALSAIVFRLASYGFTPNRVVVLGANVVILVHLALIGRAHLTFMRGARVEGIRQAATRYLPVYAGWAAIVAFVLPFVFRFA